MHPEVKQNNQSSCFICGLSLKLSTEAIREKKTKRLILPLFSIFFIISTFLFILYEKKDTHSHKTIITCVQEMLPNEEFVIHIEKMKGGFANNIWEVQTKNERYILREKTRKVKASAFIKDLEMAKKAFIYELGPEVIGVNIPRQQMLLKLIESIPWPSYEDNAEPYKQAMKALKSFHKTMPSSIPIDKQSTYAPFDFIFYTGKILEQQKNMPSHFSVALKKIELIFKYLEPWLKDNAKLCHGDFCKQNVLLSKNAPPTLIDFDSASIGDPLFDIVKFSLALSPSQRLELFKTYLGKETPSLEELNHFEAIDQSLLMLIATLRFQTAQNNHSKDMLSKSEMETILNSTEDLPSFLDVSFEDSSAKTRQLGALYALSEFLKRSSELNK